MEPAIEREGPAGEQGGLSARDLAGITAEGEVSEAAGSGKVQEPPVAGVFRTKAFAIFQIVMYVLNVIFWFGMPFWSWFFNDYVGLIYKSCETPADLLTCGNGENYTEIAVRLDRMLDGVYIGCSCSDGFLADWACAVDQQQFSISYFISSASGTGMMAALSAWPIISSWFYGPLRAQREAEQENGSTGRVVSPIAIKVATYSQVVFQFFYGLFLINTLCVVPQAHGVVVVIFIVALIVHFSTYGYVFGGFETTRGRGVLIVVIFGTLAVVIGISWPVDATWWGQRAFWLGEATGLSCAFGLAPVLTYLDITAAESKKVGSSPDVEASS